MESYKKVNSCNNNSDSSIHEKSSEVAKEGRIQLAATRDLGISSRKAMTIDQIDTALADTYNTQGEEYFVKLTTEYLRSTETIRSRILFLLFSKRPDLLTKGYKEFTTVTGFNPDAFSDETLRNHRNAFKVLLKIEDINLRKQIDIQGVTIVAIFYQIIEHNDFEKIVKDFFDTGNVSRRKAKKYVLSFLTKEPDSSGKSEGDIDHDNEDNINAESNAEIDTNDEEVPSRLGMDLPDRNSEYVESKPAETANEPEEKVEQIEEPIKDKNYLSLFLNLDGSIDESSMHKSIGNIRKYLENYRDRYTYNSPAWANLNKIVGSLERHPDSSFDKNMKNKGGK